MSVETRPSGAGRWTKCSAAPLFASRSGPQPDSDPAREGTCAAWVGDLALKNQVLRCADLVGECHENGWEVTAEMAGHIQSYVDMVKSEGGIISAERFVRLSPLVAGTLDASAMMSDGVLRVRDLKYGFQLVEADTEQLVIYGGALAAELMAAGEHIDTVVTEIYQPRGFHSEGIHRCHAWPVDVILDRCKWIIGRAEECHKPNPLATPGRHCLNCEGASGCEALASTAANIVTLAQSTGHRMMTPAEMAGRLAYLRDAKKIIDAAAAAVETEALARHMAGENIPGWSLKERLGNRKFTASREVIEVLTGIDPVKTVDMSPAEFKAAGASEMQLGVLSRRPTIGHKLTPLDAKELARQFKRE